jgi:hypothetical protein
VITRDGSVKSGAKVRITNIKDYFIHLHSVWRQRDMKENKISDVKICSGL